MNTKKWLLAMILLIVCCGFSRAESPLLIPVSLQGGTGKVHLTSPAEVRQEDGCLTAVLQWSSKNYDYMLVDDVRYEPVSTEGGSVFEIPIPSAACTITVYADTVAMSEPHLIEYTLTFGEEAAKSAQEPATAATVEDTADDLVAEYVPLKWAEGFQLACVEGGGWLITIAETDRYLLLPEGAELPEGLSDDITVLHQPLNRIYLSASGVMDMFISCDAVDHLSYSSLNRNDWYLEEAAAAMESGNLQYAGKYSAPDYELLLTGSCDLAIENTMITHAPKVAEELRALGIPVLIDRSSNETTPQGRMEWVKLYGLLTGHFEEAVTAFEQQLSMMEITEPADNSSPTVVFFYITSNGQACIRNTSDYIPRLIELAGGTYAFAQYGSDSSGATMTIQLEDFYAVACEANYIIYNSTIAGEIDSLADFTALCPLFSDLKAVTEGHVYMTSRSMYQSSMQMGTLMRDLQNMLSGDSEFQFLSLLQ